MDNLPDALLQYQLPTQNGGSRRRVTHIVHDPNLPPFTPPRLETWESAREPIGQGGQGNVYLQTCTTPGPRLGTSRALKVIRCQDDDGRRRCVRELQTMIRFIEHSRFFVQILGYYFSKSKRDLCIAMPYFPEGDLNSHLDNHGPLAEEAVCEIAGQVLQGLSIMHRAGFIHRDIKPQNILIQQRPSEGSGSWWVKLADFGISKTIDTNTETAVNIGTYDFMAPELLARNVKSSEIDYKAVDVWAVGTLLFYSLTKDKGVLSWRLSPSPLPNGRTISSEGLDFIVRATEESPADRLAWDKLTSHAWVKAHVPHISAFQDEAHKMPESSSTSATSSTRSSISSTREMVTLATRMEDTFLSINLMSDQAALDSQESTSVAQEQPASDARDTGTSGTSAATEASTATENSAVTETPSSASEAPPATMDSESSVIVTKRLQRYYDGINFMGPQGRMSLYEACSTGDLEAVRYLIRRGVDFTSGDPKQNGWTPLITAVASGQMEVVKHLLRLAPQMLEATVNASLYTPLGYAIMEGRMDMVEALIGLGANVDHVARGNTDTLIIAAMGGHLALVRLLVEKVARFNVWRGDNNSSVRYRLAGAAEGHADVVRFLTRWFMKIIIRQDVKYIAYRSRTGITTSLPFPPTLTNYTSWKAIVRGNYLGDEKNRKLYSLTTKTQEGKDRGTLYSINLRASPGGPLIAAGWTRLGPSKSALPSSVFQIPFFADNGDVRDEKVQQLKVLRGDITGTPPRITFHFTQAEMMSGKSPDPDGNVFQHFEWRELPKSITDSSPAMQTFGLFALPLSDPRCCEGRPDIIELLGRPPTPAEGESAVKEEQDEEVIAVVKLMGNDSSAGTFQLRFQRQLTPRGSLGVLATALTIWDRYMEGWTSQYYMEWALGLEKPRIPGIMTID